MDELLAILKEIHPDIEFDNEYNLIEDGILDSFDIVFLISQINEVFGVKIGAENITPENFASAEAIMNLINKIEEEY